MNTFQILLVLSHPSFSAMEISEALSTPPEQPLSPKAHIWLKKIHEGHSESEFEEGLRKALLFVQSNREFLRNFAQAGGNSQVVLSQDILLDEGKVLEITVRPNFIAELGRCEVSLTIEGWRRL